MTLGHSRGPLIKPFGLRIREVAWYSVFDTSLARQRLIILTFKFLTLTGEAGSGSFLRLVITHT